jgi:hypothetical protein
MRHAAGSGSPVDDDSKWQADQSQHDGEERHPATRGDP